MIESSRWEKWLAYTVLSIGAVLLMLPVWLTFVASTLSSEAFNHPPLPIIPGTSGWENYHTALVKGTGVPVATMLLNSTISALGIALGKIIISLLSAFAIVYFRFPFRRTIFWLIFLTIMLPVEVRIVPTYEIAVKLGLLNSYAGLILPLIASASATFLFRQFFLTVPDELLEAAMLDGTSPMRFFFDILLPLSRTSIAALFVVLFIYGWNQYLWPLLITTDANMSTIVIGLRQLMPQGDTVANWPVAMAGAMLALIPPALVIIFMQKQFVKGIIETEK